MEEPNQQKGKKVFANPHKIVKKNIEFIGRVLEVYSGDSLTIESIKTKNQARFFLTNVRAPAVGSKTKEEQPYGFEAKEYLRKRVIGKNITVQMEYEKTY